jgi:hypothetical protein
MHIPHSQQSLAMKNKVVPEVLCKYITWDLAGLDIASPGSQLHFHCFGFWFHQEVNNLAL